MSQTTPPSAMSAWSADMLWALSVSDSAVLLLDAHGRVTHVNKAARKLAERLNPQVSQAPPEVLLTLVPRDAWDVAFRMGRWQDELVVEDGGMVLNVTAYCGAREGVPRRFVMLDDVTQRAFRERELKSRHDELQSTYHRLAGAQEQLLQSEKMASIGQLAAGVAHEINNPIGYVHSNLGTLREYANALIALLDAYASREHESTAEQDELRQLREKLDIDFILGDLPKLLDESSEGIERVTKIVQDLKEFSYTGRGEPARLVDIHRGLDSTLNIVWNDLKYKVQLEKQYAQLPLVECHPSEINQVFMNLLINAGQAISERGTIVLATGCDDGHVWISINDSGCGIAPEALSRIFDPFFTTKPIGQGTGLGLAIVYRIVEKHHGRIEVDSRPGAGTRFRVFLPLRQPAGDSPPTGAATQ